MEYKIDSNSDEGFLLLCWVLAIDIIFVHLFKIDQVSLHCLIALLLQFPHQLIIVIKALVLRL